MVRAMLTSGGGAGGVISQAGGSDSGIVSKLTNPLVLAGAALVGFFLMRD